MAISLETWQWLATPVGQDAIARAPSDHAPAAIAKLRKKFDADQTRGILEASVARSKAANKLDPDWCVQLLADKAGVEMASSARASAYKAKRFINTFGDDAHIADLCCGIGADSWGMQQAGLRITGVDLEPSRISMYCNNLPSCATVTGDALRGCPSDIAAFHLDPARREGTERTRTIEDFSPGPSVWRELLKTHPSGAIKLNPGVDAYSLPAGEVEIISEPAGLTQAVLWTGELAGTHIRSASLLRDDWGVSISGEPERPDDSNEIDSYIGTLDPCVERADLVGTLIDDLDLRLVHPGTGLVTTNKPQVHAMVRWYKVLDVLPWNIKRVKSALREINPGIVEVRTRGGAVNPDEIQRELRGKGDRNDLSVLIYRLGDRVVAVIAERAQFENPADDAAPAGLDGGSADD